MEQTVMFGFNIVVSDTLCINYVRAQFRKPKTKKKRILKKWESREKNFKIIEVHKKVQIGKTLFVSQKTYDIMVRNLHQPNLPTGGIIHTLDAEPIINKS